MQEQSTIAFFKRFAEQTAREIIYTEQAYESTFYNRVILHKRTFYIPGSKQKNSYLAGFSDPKKFGDNEIFFGVFAPVQVPEDSTLIIRKKDILDRMNPFANNQSLKTGSNYLDRKLEIAGNDTSLINRLFHSQENEKVILNSLRLFDAVRIGINHVNIDFIPELNHRSHLGIFSLQKWILDTNIIENLFRSVELIVNEHGKSLYS